MWAVKCGRAEEGWQEAEALGLDPSAPDPTPAPVWPWSSPSSSSVYEGGWGEMISEALPALKSELKPLTLLWGVHLPRGSVQVGTCKVPRERTKSCPRRSPQG